MSKRVRRRMFERWMAYAHPAAGARVLDVGATPDVQREDSNCMIPWFLEQGMNLSLYSPEDISGLKEVFGAAKILSVTPGQERVFPAGNGEYDWVSSSAVLEHVGSPAEQVAFIRESARAGNGIFLTTPNRFHWLEFHTKLPLIHWLPRSLHRALLKALGMNNWASESHLRLVGARELYALAKEALGKEFDFEVRKVWALGMPSNLLLLARRRP